MLGLSLLLSSCASLAAQPTEPLPTEDFALSVAETVEAHLADRAASQTAVSLLTPSNTPTPENTLTPMLTPTALPPMVEAIEATNCRNGPGTSYIFLAVLKEGEKAEVVGRSENEDYVVIENPDGPGSCWMWLEFAELTGSIDALPLEEIPPTPTPSLTPTPSVIWADNWFIWVGPEPLTQYTMTILHNGSSLTGSFDAGSGNTVTIKGSLSQDFSNVSGTWTSTGGGAGTFEWQRSENENQFIGNLDGGPDEWCGARAGASLPSPCYGP